jgi:hypothetical protein
LYVSIINVEFANIEVLSPGEYSSGLFLCDKVGNAVTAENHKEARRYVLPVVNIQKEKKSWLKSTKER